MNNAQRDNEGNGSVLSYLLDPRAISVMTVAIILSIWQLVAAAGLYANFILPAPIEVFNAFVSAVSSGYAGSGLFEHYGITLMRVFVAWLAASVAAAGIGLAMGMFGKVRSSLDPFIEFYRPIPPLAYLILIIIWLGVGEVAKIVFLFLTAFPPIVIATASAVKGVRVERINGAKSLGANSWQIFLYVIAPSCIPGIFAGMRVSFAWTYSTIIAAEMVASNSGLGFVVLHAQRYLNTDVIFMAIFLMAFTGIALEQILRRLQTRLVPWAGRN
jgi:taurine transport system permease protein